MSRPLTAALALFLLAALASPGAAQDAPPPVQPPRPGAAPPHPADLGPPNPPATPELRAAMWPAPTADDWAKPVLLTFQRTWDDALAVAKETGRPILVCINMDGEIASEHYAGVRYREPAIAALYEPYVKVIASVYRHSPRDFDDQGRRILCPRLGSVTCGEHIAIEPILFEKFMDGQRVSPRHICVEQDGKESFDVYYINDTASVFRTVKEGIEKRPPLPPIVRSDRPMNERVASRDVTDRAAVETAYEKGDAASRKALLDAALAKPEGAPVDLLRLAVFGYDADLSKRAREALAKTDAPSATGLIAEALRVPMDAAERDALIATLGRLGDKSRLAQWLSVVHKGLSSQSGTLDAAAWVRPGGEYRAAPVEQRSVVEARRDATAEAVRARPDDAGARLALAEAHLALAMESRKTKAEDPQQGERFSDLMFEDARFAALEAERLGGVTWRTNTVVALAAYYRDHMDEAYARAEAAVKELPANEGSAISVRVITVYAESRFKAIQKAVRAKQAWNPALLTELHTAYSILLRHPLGTDAQVIWHYDFLAWLVADAQAARVLEEGVARFRESPGLHQRLRRRLLEQKGPDGLEAAYAAMAEAKDVPPGVAGFAGRASAIAGDVFRRSRAPAKAAAAYDRAVAYFERWGRARPDAKDAADSAIALAFAAKARIALDAGDLEPALADIVASYERSPGTAGTKDAYGMSPGDTGQALLVKLKDAKKDDLAAKLAAALAKLDPKLIEWTDK